MKLSLPLLLFAVFATTDVVASKKKKVTQSKKLTGNKNNAWRNQDNKLDAVPPSVESDRDLQQGVTTKIVGGNNANNGEYPFFGESVLQPTRRLKCAGYIYKPKWRAQKQRCVTHIIFLTYQCFADFYSIQSGLVRVCWFLDLSYYCVDCSSLQRIG